MGVLLALAAIYILLALVVMFLQRGMIYFPTKLASNQAKQAAAENGFVPWRNQAGQIIGWELPANAPTTGAVLILHGNAACAVDRDYLAKPIHDAAPVKVFILEYPGYGAREGSPSERSLLAAADEAFQMLTNETQIYIVSESLGAGMAAHLAKAYSARVSGLMLFMPYNKLVSVAQEKMPFLPVWLLLWDRFDPEDWLKDYHGPVKIALAERDEVIPMKFGRQLYETYQGPKSLQIFPNAGHNDIAAQSPDWWKEVFSFWRQYAKTTHAAP
ncbi:MAG: alpha/beta hydrolase [Verrucomicrobiota bacterium]|jgi:pimeloyl-ACP methyl ester carboxylesterase